MARKNGEQTNWRVEVYPKTTVYGFTVADAAERCRDIAQAIKRHVDDVQQVAVTCDYEYVCGYCGRIWTENRTDYNGGCCAADEEAEQGRLAAASAASVAKEG